MSNQKPEAKKVQEETQAQVDVNHADVLDPRINLTEESLIAEKAGDKKQVTSETSAEEIRLKNEKYDREKEADVTRSPLDKGQEAVLSPEAAKTLKESTKK